MPCKYDTIGPFYYSRLVNVIQNGKYGFINTQGEEVIPCKYDYADWFSNGLAKVIEKGKCGRIDTDGNFYYSHDVSIDNFDWLTGHWYRIDGDYYEEPFLTIYSNGEVEEGLDNKVKKTASMFYDESTDKYFIECSRNNAKKTYYQVDLIGHNLISMDGTLLKNYIGADDITMF